MVPLPSKHKMRAAMRAAAMGRKNKKLKIKNNSTEALTVSPESLSGTNEKNEEKKKNEKILRTDAPTMVREIRSLQKGDWDWHKMYIKEKQDNGNRILHWDSLQTLITTNTVCKCCGTDVSFKELTTGISTQVILTCKNPRCGMNESNKVKKTNYKKHKFRIDSAESFAVNCQFVLSLLQSGCGSVEASTFITFMDLPNAPSFQRKTFARIQDAMRPEIKKITDFCMETARDEEILKTIGENKYEEFKKNTLQPTQIPLTVMYDMGWNKRSSGNKYDSISGHGFLVGGNSKKVLNYRCMSKRCRKCANAKLTKQEPPPHECPKNHLGSSKSMETEAIWLMVQESYYNHGFTCSVIVTDDNSTMKSNLKHSWKEKVEKGIMKQSEWPRTKRNVAKKDTGRLPLDVPEPSFLADFNHRVKTVGKTVYGLAALSKRESEVSKEIAARIKAYWGTMLKQIRYLHWEEENEDIKGKVLAPIEHLFNNHQYCDAQWCYILKAQKEGKSYVPEENRPLYDKDKHNKMYQQLKEVVTRFQTEENIRECLHKYDTQVNEGLNMSVSRYVPKFKHYGTTMSLDTRIRCVIGHHNMGYETYYKTLLYNLGCLQKDDNCHLSAGLARINEAKLRNRQYKQKLENKRKRKHGQLARTKEQIYEEGVDRANNLGTYQTGVAILNNENNEENTQQPTNQQQKNIKVCSKCGASGHKTWRTRTCPYHHEYLQTKATKSNNKKTKNSATNLIATENKEEMVRIKNEKKDKMSDGAGMVVGEGGVAMAGVEGLPLPEATDVSASAKKNQYAVASLQKISAQIDVQKKIKKFPLMTLPVSTPVYCVPISTSVHGDTKKSISTDVDCTQPEKNNMNDSSDNLKLSVEGHVQNSKNVSQIQSNFEFDLDEDSDISFMSSSSSVGEYGDAAI